MYRFALSLLRAVVRRTWLIASITVLCCAAFAARAAAALVDADYLMSVPRPAAPPVAPRPPPPPRSLRDGDKLVERNMFCSSCAPARGSGAADGFALPPASLIAIDVEHEPRATVHVLASEVQGSWGPGDAIPGLGHIDRIGPTWIDVVDDAGHRGRLSLRDPAGRGADIDPRPTAPGSGCGPAAAAWIDRLRRFDDQTYEVDRALVRDLVTGVSKGAVHAVPIFENGEIKGVRLRGVTACSIAGALGLKSGDMLTTIDGEPLRSIQLLLDLYARLDQLSVVELAGTRAGKPLVRTLRLR